jgi:DNA-directed RNA polymerase III subunit RPC2
MEDASLLGGDELYSKDHYMAPLNGQRVGVHRQPVKFVRNFRFLRKRGRIQEFVSFYLNNQQNCIYISSDGGRLVRTLLTVEKGRVRLQQRDIVDLVIGLKNFNDFLRDGLIEYLDVNEENNALIALNEERCPRTHSHGDTPFHHHMCGDRPDPVPASQPVSKKHISVCYG